MCRLPHCNGRHLHGGEPGHRGAHCWSKAGKAAFPATTSDCRGTRRDGRDQFRPPDGAGLRPAVSRNIRLRCETIMYALESIIASPDRSALKKVATMRLYQNIAAMFETRITEGVYRVGDRLPSVREASRSLSVSLTTVYHAYNLLETKGLIRAKPQSGYSVVRRYAVATEDVDSKATPPDQEVVPVLETIARQVLGEAGRDITVPFGSIFLDAKLLPITRLLKVMRYVSRRPRHSWGTKDAAGILDLRREIAKRYTRCGYSVPLHEIIITGGAIDGINLALSTLLRPGDAVAVEDPCFFPASFSLRRFGLKSVPIPVSANDGLDLGVLERVLANGGAKACLMMPTCQNPLGVTLSLERKARLVRLIERYDVPLIENDAYGELLPPEEGGSSCKANDRSGSVLHCSSFSNSLSPELRVGWITAGRFRDRILSVKFLTSMSSHGIAQQTVADFLKHENFDHHMRNLRSTLDERRRTGLIELDKWGQLLTCRSDPKGGYLIWVKLPEDIDSLHLFKLAAAEGLSFVPGALFSVEKLRQNEIALNFSFAWTRETIRSLDRLRSLIEEMRTDSSDRVVNDVNAAAVLPHF